ncbi:MAG: hypothetical protein ACJ8LG_24285 [Massilia sp.]
MARAITSFSGNTCIVGRGWAPEYRHSGNGLKFEAPSWYMFSGDKYHSPAISYYIDNVRTCAADLVTDFGALLPPEVVPDKRFSLVILEFLPVALFQKGKFALSNAARITSDDGAIEVHSGESTLRDVAVLLGELGFTGELAKEIHIQQCSGDIIRKYFDPGYAAVHYREEIHIDKLVCRRRL